jgi:hypothetical protein
MPTTDVVQCYPPHINNVRALKWQSASLFEFRMQPTCCFIQLCLDMQVSNAPRTLQAVQSQQQEQDASSEAAVQPQSSPRDPAPQKVMPHAKTNSREGIWAAARSSCDASVLYKTHPQPQGSKRAARMHSGGQ